MFFGAYRLSKITAYLIEQFKIMRRQQVSPRTCNIELNCAKQLFRLAEEWGFNLKNPATKIKRFKEFKKIPRYLSIEEIHKLLDAASPWMKKYILIATLINAKKLD